MVNIYFLDSSTLVKRYVVEIGSPSIKTLTDSQTGNSLLLIRITWVEVLSAFAQRQREGGYKCCKSTTLIQKFRNEFNSRYRVIEVDPALIERAGELVIQYPLRPMMLYNWHRLCTLICFSINARNSTNFCFGG